MQTFTTIIAASALLSYVSGSPIQARGNTCGGVPAGSGSVDPLSQPAGIDTAEKCQAAGAVVSGCESFVFGFDDEILCKLYSVPASKVPPQPSANLLAYDLACASVPAVVPTASNPTGNTPANSSPSRSGDNSENSSPSKTGNNLDSYGKSGPMLAVRDTCGGTPTGPTGNASPIANPLDIDSLPACLTKCQAYSGCESCAYGSLTAGGPQVCYLYSVSAGSVPAPADGQSLVVSDVGCSSSPSNAVINPVSNGKSSPKTNDGNNQVSNGKSGNGSPK